jgi:hypothetical protein
MRALRQYGVKLEMRLRWEAIKVANPTMSNWYKELQHQQTRWCWGPFWFAKKFKVCTLDGIKAILGNNFLNVYHVDVLRRSSKLKVIARLTNRFVSLKIKYQASLAKVGIHVVSLRKL